MTDRVVTFVGGPMHNQRELRHDVPASIDKAGIDGQVHRYVFWAGVEEGRQPVARESFHNATYVQEGLSPEDLTEALRSLSSPPFVPREE